MRLTQKQLELMRVIIQANPDGAATDLDQILERLKYETTKASVQFSIRALIAHGLIEKAAPEKRRGRQRVLIVPTILGNHFGAPKFSTPMTVSVEDDELLQELEVTEK